MVTHRMCNSNLFLIIFSLFPFAEMQSVLAQNLEIRDQSLSQLTPFHAEILAEQNRSSANSNNPQAFNIPNFPGGSTQQHINSAMEKYQREFAKAELGFTVLETAGTLGVSAAEAFGQSYSKAATYFAIPMTSAVIGQAYQGFKEQTQNYLASQIYVDLQKKPGVVSFRNAQELDSYFEKNGAAILSNVNLNDAYSRASGRHGEQAINRVALDALKSLVAQNDMKLDFLELKNKNSSKLSKQERKELTEIIAWKAETSEKLKDLVLSQEQLTQGYKDLSDKVSKIDASKTSHAEMLFVQGINSPNVPASEKINMINSGTVIFNDDELKKETLRTLKLQKVVDEDIVSTLGQANNIMLIAKNLNVGGQFAREVSKGLVMGEVVRSAVSMYLRQDYWGAAAGMTGLLSGGKDSEQQQMQKMLGIMDQKLDLILKNQEAMMKALASLQQASARILEKLDFIQARVENMQEMLTQSLKNMAGVDRCVLIENSRGSFQHLGKFQNFQKRADHFESVSAKNSQNPFNTCLDSLGLILSTGRNPVLLAKTYPGAEHIVRAYEENYRLAYGFLQDTTNRATDLPLINDKLRNPFLSLFVLLSNSSNLEDLTLRKKAVLNSNELDYGRIEFSMMTDLLHPIALKPLVDFLIQNHMYRLLAPKNEFGIEKLKTPLELVQNLKPEVFDPRKDNRNTVWGVTDLLKNALRIVNLAIAQQNLLSGDLLTEAITQYLTTENTSEMYTARSYELLKRNPLVRENWIRYFIYKKIKENEKTNFDFIYSTNLEQKDLKYLQKILGRLPSQSHLEVRTDSASKRSFVELVFDMTNSARETLRVRLPKIQELMIGVPARSLPTLTTVDMSMLLELRSQLVGEIFKYRGFDSFTVDERKATVMMIMSR